MRDPNMLLKLESDFFSNRNRRLNFKRLEKDRAVLNIVFTTEKSWKKYLKLAVSDTEEDGNLSVEEVLTEDQEEIEEIVTTEVVNGGEPAGLYEGEPIVNEECQRNKLKTIF